jgi:hypothetical protein
MQRPSSLGDAAQGLSLADSKALLYPKADVIWDLGTVWLMGSTFKDVVFAECGFWVWCAWKHGFGVQHCIREGHEVAGVLGNFKTLAFC